MQYSVHVHIVLKFYYTVRLLYNHLTLTLRVAFSNIS